jgi:hypothetical protein
MRVVIENISCRHVPMATEFFWLSPRVAIEKILVTTIM